MTTAVLRVLQSGPHVSWQDAGRRGKMRFGVPQSGPMDRVALAAANLAAGNAAHSAAIEISLGGLIVECLSGRLTLAVAGGGFLVETDDHRPGSWSTLPLRAGQRLTIRPGHWGCWTYLALAGQPRLSTWLGSSATHIPSGRGGGRLVTGQEIVVDDPRASDDPPRPIPCPVWARPRDEIHVVTGPQDRFFDADVIGMFYANAFALTGAYDRMGVRLSGPRLHSTQALAIPSEPIMRGSVQVAGDGVPTVLLADHQTTGGYPKIATIIDDDMDGFVQLRPNDAVGFRQVTAQQAVRIARQRATSTNTYLHALTRLG